MGIPLETVKRALQHAYLAKDVYSIHPNPGAYWRESTARERMQANLTEGDLGSYNGGYFARMYVSVNTGERCIAFRGSMRGSDWGDNFDNAVGLYSRSYHMAGKVGRAIGGTGVTVTGHSLGGGLAFSAAKIGGLSGDTFNAAWTGWATNLSAWGPSEKSGGADIDLWVVDGDPLTFWAGFGDGRLHILKNPDKGRIQTGVANIPFHSMDYIINLLMTLAVNVAAE